MTDDARREPGRAASPAGAATAADLADRARRWDEFADRARRWEDDAARYRADWENRYGTSRPWPEHEDAFRYGWEAGADERFRGRNYQEAEADLEADFPMRYEQVGKGYFGGRDEDAAWAATPPSRRDEARLEQAREQAESRTAEDGLARTWHDFKDTVREGFERAREEFDKRA
jgi:hypothetical protein